MVPGSSCEYYVIWLIWITNWVVWINRIIWNECDEQTSATSIESKIWTVPAAISGIEWAQN